VAQSFLRDKIRYGPRVNQIHKSGYVTKSILRTMEVIAWTRAPNEENRLHTPYTNSRYCRYGHTAKRSIHTQGHYLDKVCDLSSIAFYVSFTNSVKLAKINQAIFIPRIACAKCSRHKISKLPQGYTLTQTKISHKGDVSSQAIQDMATANKTLLRKVKIDLNLTD